MAAVSKMLGVRVGKSGNLKSLCLIPGNEVV